MLAAWGSSVPYAVNAVTFLVSAVLIARIPRGMLQSEEPLTRGHWRDVADGFRLVVTARPLFTVLIVWNVVLIGAGAVNVAEVFFAKDTLDAGDLGFGAIIAASGRLPAGRGRETAPPCRRNRPESTEAAPKIICWSWTSARVSNATSTPRSSRNPSPASTILRAVEFISTTRHRRSRKMTPSGMRSSALETACRPA